MQDTQCFATPALPIAYFKIFKFINHIRRIIKQSLVGAKMAMITSASGTSNVGFFKLGALLEDGEKQYTFCKIMV